MKALELENYGVSELAYLEQEETDGGVLGFDDLLIGIAIYVLTQVIEGVADGLQKPCKKR